MSKKGESAIHGALVTSLRVAVLVGDQKSNFVSDVCVLLVPDIVETVQELLFAPHQTNQRVHLMWDTVAVLKAGGFVEFSSVCEKKAESVS